jgi:hypothetical protein
MGPEGTPRKTLSRAGKARESDASGASGKLRIGDNWNAIAIIIADPFNDV